MLRKIVLVSALSVVVPVSAAPQDEVYIPLGVELWGGLKTGMSKDEVNALGNEKKFELVKDCRVSLNPRYKDKVLVGVTIASRWTMAYNRCAELVKRSLVAKYGESVSVESFPATSYSTFGPYVVEKWLTDDVVISLGWGGSGGDRLKFISYEPRMIVEEAELIDNL